MESLAVTVTVDEPVRFLVAVRCNVLPVTQALTMGLELPTEKATTEGAPAIVGKIGTAWMLLTPTRSDATRLLLGGRVARTGSSSKGVPSLLHLTEVLVEIVCSAFVVRVTAVPKMLSTLDP